MRSKRKQRGFLGSLVTAVAPALIGGLFGSSGQKSANKTNVALSREQMAFEGEQAQKQMDFQERMRGTQYQTAIGDMKAAGLNPMLAYSQGGAGTPTGAMARGNVARVENSASVGMASAMQAASVAQSMAQVRNVEAQTKNVEANTAKTKSETYDAQLNEAIKQAELKHAKFRNLSAEEQVRIIRWELKKIQLEYQLQEGTFSAEVARRKAESGQAVTSEKLLNMEVPRKAGESKFYEKMGEEMPWLRGILEVLRGLSNAGAVRR